MAVFQTRENAQLARLMILSEMQLALSTSSTAKDPATTSSDAQSQRDQETGNSIWDKVFDDSGTSQDEEDQEDASRI